MKKNNILIKFIKNNIPFLILVFLVIISPFLTKSFLVPRNILSIFLDVSIFGIMAIGVTFALILGCFDLSIGAMMALSAALAVGMQEYVNIYLSVIIAIVACLLAGLINGLLVTKARINPFIATLGTNMTIYGIVYLYTNYNTINAVHDKYVYINDGKLFYINFPIWLLIFFYIIASIVLYKTKYGKIVYSIGGNEYISRLFGINTHLYKIITYILSGFFCAISGVIVSSRVMAAIPSFGENAMLIVVGGVVMGGISILGGIGKLHKAIVGIFMLSVLQDIFALLNIPYGHQQYIWGAVFVIVVILDRRRHQKFTLIS